MYRGQTTPLHVQRSALQSQLGTRPAGDIGDTNHHLTSENVVVISRA